VLNELSNTITSVERCCGLVSISRSNQQVRLALAVANGRADNTGVGER
jgi:hypothetical protein